MKAIVATSADPLHFGHVKLFEAAARIFGRENTKLVIGKNPNKHQDFSQISYHLAPYNLPYEIVLSNSLNEYCSLHDITHIVRGIRNENDVGYELELDKRGKGLQTIFFPAEEEYEQLSSTFIKENIDNTNLVMRYLNPDALFRYRQKKPVYCVFFGDTMPKVENIFNMDEFIKEQASIDWKMIFSGFDKLSSKEFYIKKLDCFAKPLYFKNLALCFDLLPLELRAKMYLVNCGGKIPYWDEDLQVFSL